MKKIICAFALGLLTISFSALQAKDQGLATKVRVKEAAKGTAFATIAAANCYFLYHIGGAFVSGVAQSLTTLQDKTPREAAEQLGRSFGVLCALGGVVWATSKTAQFSYESFKKAFMKPKEDLVIDTEVVQPS